MAYRFAFCTLAPVVVLTTVISLLGVLRILRVFIVAALFFGVFIVQLLRMYNPFPGIVYQLHCISNKTLTWKRLLLKMGTGIRTGVKEGARSVLNRTRGDRLKYVFLIAALVYGTVYFSYTALQLHSYGASDQYTHSAWLYALINGTIYPKGVYPEGMHCIEYVLSCLFGIRAHSVNLFLAGVHSHAVLLSAYIMMRELFRWRFTPVIALWTFLTLRFTSVAVISSVSRLAWTLPQEFAFTAVFLSACSLMRFLKRRPSEREVRGMRAFSPRNLMRDEDLPIFMLAVCVTIVVHFYATIMAIFICLGVFAVNILRHFRWKKLLQAVITALLALVIAVAPMGIALAAGYGLQGSMRWAIAVTKGGEQAWAEGNYDPSKNYLEAETEENPEVIVGEPAQESVSQMIAERAGIIYEETFDKLYPGQRGWTLCVFTLVTALVSALGTVIILLLRPALIKAGKKLPSRSMFAGYLTSSATLIILMISYAPRLFGLPILISGSRLGLLIALFAVIVSLCIPDFLLSFLDGKVSVHLLNAFSAAVCVAAVAVIVYTGCYHGYLYNEQSRYPAAVDLTERIVLNMPQNMYTIVSTTDEYYQMIGSGYHEELLDFVEKRHDREYTLPTPYIFVFLEKKPLHYVQILFASGPEWLGNESYADVVRQYREDVCVYPDILHGETSPEIAKERLHNKGTRSGIAAALDTREILESRAIEWMEAFSYSHPQDGSVVYEDDRFMCYCVLQNPYSLFNLGIVD